MNIRRHSWVLKFTVCLFSCAVLVWGVHAADAAPAASSITLEQVSEALGNAQTVMARFVQERHLSLFKEPLRSEGYLCFEQPAQIRWEVTKPYRSVLVSDGSGVAQFEYVGDRWKKLDLGLSAAVQQVIAQIAGVMKGRYANSQREYQATLSNTADGPVVTLAPRNARMQKMIKAIEVHLAPDLKGTRRVVLREQGGDYTEIHFSDQVVNLKFADRTFDRNAPLEIERVLPTAAKPGP